MPLPVILALIQILGPPAAELIRELLIPLVRHLVQEMTDDDDERTKALEAAHQIVDALPPRYEA